MTAAPVVPAGTWRWSALAAAPALLLLAWQVAFVWPFFSDDSFISLRYSERLLAGDGLTWTDGERVEGYSNLLWVLGCAGLGALGLDLVTAARALGAAASAAALVAIARATAPHDLRSVLPAAVAPLLAASTQVALGWTLSGLEGPLVLAWLALGFGALVRRHAANGDVASWPRAQLVAASVPFALLCWTRPDAPLWVAATAVALAVHGRGLRPLLVFAALPFAAFAAQLGFRVVYHGDVVPNTAHVKAELAASALGPGRDYVLAALGAHAGLAVAAAAAGLALALTRRTRALATLLLLPSVVWLLYLAAIGGDHFPGRRLLHGAVAPLALVVAAWLAHAGRARAPLALLALGGVAWNVHLARSDPQSHELRGEVWEWRGAAVGRALHDAFADRRPLLAVDAAGAVPYHAKLPALDLLGLCDRTIARTPQPAWFATAVPGTPFPPGHLRGNGRYVLERAPDLFLFGMPPGSGPLFASGVELEEDPRFLRGYRLVALHLGPTEILPGRVEMLTAYVWVRVLGAVGVRADDRTVDIPGWLLGSFELQVPLVRRYQPLPTDPAERAALAAEAARLNRWHGAPDGAALPDANGRLRGHLAARTTGLRVPLAAGTWRWRVHGDGAGHRVEIAGATPGPGADELVVATGGETEVRLLLAADAALPATIDRVELVRTDR